MNEKEIRSCLIEYLSNKHEPSNTVFISELFVNNFSCRADLVMANGQLSVFEIKSKLDTLDRLPTQVEHYTSSFENVVVVCAEKHIDKVLNTYDSSIGVWLIRDNGQIIVKRRSNKINLNVSSWLMHLSVSELKNLLKLNKIPSSGNRGELLSKVQKGIPKYKIRAYVLSYFKNRQEKILKLKQNKLKNLNKSSSILTTGLILEDSPINLKELTILPRRTKTNPNPRPIPVRLRS
ncbi:sce7726 family protein [Acinetobacter courvalinii]|uniref:sce7726 family protein n=1 Tax=Acinetobacter courvalinii TaxID=280147 RepID=UPI0021D205A1|nr:sce7726 family protein [Acinetobacter courvalinii]MCU4576030.1 sce7726 family protein [Acinetobacter courvalinii]